MARYVFQDAAPSQSASAPTLNPSDFNSVPPPAAGEQDYLSTIAGDKPAPRYVFAPEAPPAPVATDASGNAVAAAPTPPAPPPYDPNQKPGFNDKPGVIEDVAKSALFRGAPEGLAASTPLGIGLNALSAGVSLAKAAGRGGYKALTGDELPDYTGTNNLVPTSSDVVRSLSKNLLGKDLYEPQTTPGKFANTVAQFGTGAAAMGAPVKAIATSAIPAAVVSEGAGQVAKGTDWEAPARLAGAVLGGAGGSAASGYLGRPKIPQVTADDIKTLSTAAYQKADQVGGVLKPHLVDGFIQDIQSATPQTAAGKIFAGASPVTELVDRAKNLAGKPLSLQEAQEIDEHLGDTITGLFKTAPKQATKMLDVQSKFRNMIENANPNDVIGGKAGFDSLKEGRALWSQQAKLRDVEKIITNAESTDNPVTSLKAGFRNIAKNDARMRGYDADTKAAIKHAAKTGVVTNVLRVAGSRLNPIAAATIGFSTGGPVGAVVSGGGTYAVSAAARGLAEKLQMNRTNAVIESILGQNKPAPGSFLRTMIPDQRALALPTILNQLSAQKP